MSKYVLPKHAEVNIDEFERLIAITVEEPADKHNYCARCNVPAQIIGIACVCPRCGEEQQLAKADISHQRETLNANVIIRTGPKKGTPYHVPRGSGAARGKAVLDHLQEMQRAYSQKETNNKRIPDSILITVADQYNQIQVATHIVNGEERPFVRRGLVKNQILAALIYLECTNQHIVRDAQTIAEFMQLEKAGFANGIATLSKLAKTISIKIDTDAVSITGFIDNYTEALNMNTDRYKGFILDLVVTSERLNICIHSRISSKIVGAIWLIIVKEKLNIPASKVEAAADQTRKNTFIKFTNAVLSNIASFASIFTKYNIPI